MSWPEPEVGWGLLKCFATEASLHARAYGFSTIGFKTLISFIDLRNVASRAVAERMGAKYERTAMMTRPRPLAVQDPSFDAACPYHMWSRDLLNLLPGGAQITNGDFGEAEILLLVEPVVAKLC